MLKNVSELIESNIPAELTVVKLNHIDDEMWLQVSSKASDGHTWNPWCRMACTAAPMGRMRKSRLPMRVSLLLR